MYLRELRVEWMELYVGHMKTANMGGNGIRFGFSTLDTHIRSLLVSSFVEFVFLCLEITHHPYSAFARFLLSQDCIFPEQKHTHHPYYPFSLLRNEAFFPLVSSFFMWKSWGRVFKCSTYEKCFKSIFGSKFGVSKKSINQ